MRILITGVSGLLGAHLAAALQGEHEVAGVDSHPLWGDVSIRFFRGDLTDPAFVDTAMHAFVPEILIHCAALTDVDACEKNERLAYAVNVGTTEALVKRLKPNTRFVYISTDAVLRGDQPLATEQDVVAPRTVYGRSKRKAEQVVERGVEHHLIIRTNFFGWSSGRKKTFGEWLYRSLERGLPIHLYKDVFFTPLYVMDLVGGLQRLMEGQHRGLFHLTGRERLSKYEFAARLAALAGFSMAHARKNSLSEGEHAAPRARELSLDSSHFEAATGMTLPTCEQSLRRFLQDRSQSLRQRCAAGPENALSGQSSPIEGAPNG